MRPSHGTEHFGQNGAGAAGDLCTPQIPWCTIASEVNAQLSPSSSGTKKHAEQENSPMRTRGIRAPNTIASLLEFSFFHTLGCQVGGAALTRVYTVVDDGLFFSACTIRHSCRFFKDNTCISVTMICILVDQPNPDSVMTAASYSSTWSRENKKDISLAIVVCARKGNTENSIISRLSKALPCHTVLALCKHHHARAECYIKLNMQHWCLWKEQKHKFSHNTKKTLAELMKTQCCITQKRFLHHLHPIQDIKMKTESWLELKCSIATN